MEEEEEEGEEEEEAAGWSVGLVCREHDKQDEADTESRSGTAGRDSTKCCSNRTQCLVKQVN